MGCNNKYIFCLTQRTIDALKIDVEGAEWPFLRDILSDMDSLLNVKQLLIEIHTPRNLSERKQMSLTDFAQVYYSLQSLKYKLGFRNFLYHDRNNCCGRFTILTPKTIAGKVLCCYEIFYINGKYLV